jgi:long-chain fatty acid transport protein
MLFLYWREPRWRASRAGRAKLEAEEPKMNKNALSSTLLAATIATGLTSISGVAAAAGFALMEQNASGLGNAYSGAAAAAEDASTIYFNPAGVIHLPGRQVVGALSAIRPSTEFSNTASCAPYAGIGAGTATCPFGPNGNLGHFPGGNGGDASDWGFVPAGYLSWQVAPSWWVGLGVNAPFGLKTEWDSTWVGRFHAIKSEVKSVNINPTVAWKVNEIFSIGGGINAMWFDAELTNAVSYRAVALSTGIAGIIAGTPSGSEGVSTVKGDDWGWGWNLGGMLNFGPADRPTRVGLHYRSRITFTLEGDTSFANRPVALNAVLPNGGIKADIKLPDTVSVALSHHFTPRWQVLADFTYTGWDTIQNLTVFRTSGALLTSLPLGFLNSWRVGLGANFQLNDQWKLRAGVAYDKTPVQDAFRTPRLPDEDRTWLAGGAQWAWSKQAALDFGVAYLFVQDASSLLRNQETPTSLPRGSLVGTYEADVWILSAQVRFNF